VAVLQRNQDNLDRSIELLAPFVRVFANTLGNGRWFDTYVENLIPVEAAPAPPGGTS
jgi:phospholipid/cholesterol/gamma-HCH transport system substrate-binding protein